MMLVRNRGGICQCRQCRRQCKIFASGVNFSIFTHFVCFFLLKLLKLGEIDGAKFSARKSGGVNFWTNSMTGIKRFKVMSMGKFGPAALNFEIFGLKLHSESHFFGTTYMIHQN